MDWTTFEAYQSETHYPKRGYFTFIQLKFGKISFSKKQVLGGAILQQVFVVEFVVHNQMCNDCRRIENKDFWRAVVQIRQKVCNVQQKSWKSIHFEIIIQVWSQENVVLHGTTGFET